MPVLSHLIPAMLWNRRLLLSPITQMRKQAQELTDPWLWSYRIHFLHFASWTPGFPDLPHFTGHSCLFGGLLHLFPSCCRLQARVHDAFFCLHSLLRVDLYLYADDYNISVSSPDLQTNIQLPIVLASQTKHILPSRTYSLHSTPTLTYLGEWHHCPSSSPGPKPKRYAQCASLTPKWHFQALSKSYQCYLQIIRIHHSLILL